MNISGSCHPDVVLLVGGLGTRLRATVGDGTPKPLARVGEHPFLWYLFRYLQEQGMERALLATSHLSDAFRMQLEDYAPCGIRVDFSFEESPRGTGGALVEALPLVSTDPFVAMNGDSFVHAPIQEMVEAHRRRSAVATIALARVEDCSRFGTVEVDAAGTITAFREKMGLMRSGWINAGIYILSKQALEPVLERTNSSLETDLFPHWIGRGLQGYCVESPFIDIGVPESYGAAGAFFKACNYG